MVVLYIFAGMFLLLLLLLVMPIKVVMSFNTSYPDSFKLRVSWLFGIVRSDVSRKFRYNKREIPEIRSKKKQTNIDSTSLTWKLRFAKLLIPRILTLARDILRRLKADIAGTITFGFSEPDYTGMAFAAAGSLNAVLNTLPGYNVRMIPAFEDEDMFEGNMDAKITMIPIRMVVPALKFGFSREALGILKSLIFKKYE